MPSQVPVPIYLLPVGSLAGTCDRYPGRALPVLFTSWEDDVLHKEFGKEREFVLPSRQVSDWTALATGRIES